jgi:Tfp pilus assembly protein PilN
MTSSEERVKDIVRAEPAADDGLVRVQAALTTLNRELALPGDAPKPEPLPSRLAGAAFLCLGSIIGGLIMSAHYAKQVSMLEAQRKEMDAEVASIARSARLEAAQANDLMRYSLLSKQGVPVVGLMDEITRSLPSGVGISTVVVNQNGTTRIEGEAASEEAMLEALKQMKEARSLTNLHIIGFRRDAVEHKGGRFAFGAKCISMKDVRIGGQP